MTAKKGRLAVRFDELAFEQDLLRASQAGRLTAQAARREFERDGVWIAQLRPCDPEGRDGTRLPHCVKTYLPFPDGHFGMVLRAVTGNGHLRFLAFGVRHHPNDSHALTVYEIAHRRLHEQSPEAR